MSTGEYREPVYEELGARLRLARKARGLKIKQVTAALGVSKQRVVQWEAGGSRIQIADLMLLGELYNLPPGEFLSGLDIDSCRKPAWLIAQRLAIGRERAQSLPAVQAKKAQSQQGSTKKKKGV